MRIDSALWLVAIVSLGGCGSSTDSTGGSGGTSTGGTSTGGTSTGGTSTGGTSTGGTSTGGTSTGGTGGSAGAAGAAGTCVGDSTSPGSCAVTWKLLDPCPLITSGDEIEIAVFDGSCPIDSTLASGDTSSAVFRSTFAATQTFSPVTGLGATSYGFAFLVRSTTCAVKAFGCTTADLTQISQIQTAVCDWSDSNGQCACTPLSGGTCPGSESCNAGSCSGAT